VLVMMFAIVVGIAHGDSYWSIILAVAISAPAIQLAYLAGIQIRATVEKFRYYGVPRQPNGTSGKKPSASLIMIGRGRTPLEQRPANEPLAPAALRPSTARKEVNEAETGQRPTAVSAHRGRR